MIVNQSGMKTYTGASSGSLCMARFKLRSLDGLLFMTCVFVEQGFVFTLIADAG